MQPTNNSVPPGELPRPHYEPMPGPAPEQAAPAAPETAHNQAIEQGISPATPPPMSMPALPTAPPIQPASAAMPASSDQSSALSPQIADDADLIEKEWVTKAKQIVEQTKHDPYMQTKEMNKMKADYLKKRYAKDLKLPEEQ